MEKIGIEASDTRDHLGRGRFFTYEPELHLNPVRNPKFWYHDFIAYPEKPVCTY